MEAANDNSVNKAEGGEMLAKAVTNTEAGHVVQEALGVKVSVMARLLGNSHPSDLLLSIESQRVANDNREPLNDAA